MTRPGSRPGPVRSAAYPVVLLVLAALAAAVGLLGAPATASPRTATTTTTTTPWVPGVNGTMTVGIDQAPTGCNPNVASGDTWADRLVLQPVLPSAFEINPNDQAVYDPATITQAELQSTSPETIVYTINPKAVWSDGKPVTAEDFVYTWDEERGTTGPVGPPVTTPNKTPPKSSTTTTLPTPTTSPVSGTPAPTPSTAQTPAAAAAALPGATGLTGPALGYRQIASITPSDHGRAFTVVFRRPYADWQSLFDDLLPAHVLQRVGWDPACTTVDPAVDLSAGPFVIAKVVPGREVDLVRNRRWWEQEPNLARLDILVASGPQQLAQWLHSGKIDVALPSAYDQSYLQTVTSQPSVLTQSQSSTTFLELQFATTAPATSAVGLRTAVAHAVDRQALVNKVVGWADSTIVPAASHLFAQPQNGYPPHKPPPLQVSGQPGYAPATGSKKPTTSTPFPPTAAPQQTAKLLGDLGYLRSVSGAWTTLAGKPLTLRMAVDEGDTWAAETGAEVAHQLGAAGIGVTVVPAPSAQAAGEDLVDGKADMALLPMHASAYASQAIAWYTPLLGVAGSGGSQDWSGFDDPTLNGLLERAAAELNPVDAAPIYGQADALLWQDMVALPLFVQPSLLAWSGVTSGVSPDPNLSSLLWSVQSWTMRVPPTSPDTAG